MVETIAKSSSKKASVQEVICQALASRKQKAHGNKGGSTSQHTERDYSEDLSDIRDDEVVGYLNNKKEYFLKKILWERMNQEYQKGRKKKKETRKKKTAPTAKTVTNASISSAETESKKRLSSLINYDALEKLFESDEPPKRAKLEKPEGAEDLKEDLEQDLLESQNAKERTEINDFDNENYCDGDMNEDEYYYGADLEYQNEGDDYDYYNNFDDEEEF